MKDLSGLALGRIGRGRLHRRPGQREGPRLRLRRALALLLALRLGRRRLLREDRDLVLASEEPAYLELTPGVWTLTEAEAAIPAGTRTIKICRDSHRESLPASVAFDDASLEINPGNALTVLPVAVYQISAQVGRGFPGAATVDVS